MTSFRDLLKYDPVSSQNSTPGDEQTHASNELVHAVERSHLKWWKDVQTKHCNGKYLVVVVAPYSQYDLTLLDMLDQWLDTGPAQVQVFLANLKDYASIEQLQADIPGISEPQTPIVAFCDSTSRTVASGKNARVLIAQALDLSAEEVMRRVFTESPTYTNIQHSTPSKRLDKGHE